MEETGIPPNRPRRLRLTRVVVAGVAVVLVAGLGGFVAANHGSSSNAETPALHGTVVRATPVPTDDPGPTTTTLALSQPENPPAADAQYADVPVTPIGSIEIPRIGLATAVYEGIWLTVLDRGPGHWPGTAAPGGYGNTVIAGHRVTHSEPFRHIDELVPGDSIVLADASGRYTYAVTGHEIVTPDQVDIVTQRPGHTITLFACHPPGSAAYRYVVLGTLVSAPRPGA